MAIAAPLLMHPALLKWIINVIVGVVLVGLAFSTEQRELQILIWILAGAFGVAVLWNEWKRPAAVGARLARSAG